jgi:hypothetical protein
LTLCEPRVTDWGVPLSRPALEVLDIAVRLNPDGARLLLVSLRAAPSAVTPNPHDRFGPLGHMVVDTEWSGSAAATPARYRRPALPARFHEPAEALQREWLAGSFTKAELADAVERCLELAGEAIPPQTGGWRTVGGDQGTRRDPLERVFPTDTR